LLVWLAFGFAFNGIANHQLFEKANEAYEKEDYVLSLNLYTNLIDSFGFESENLYYNLGNTHYKLGNLGQSILCFEKALKHNPNNKNIQHNLKIAQSNTVDYTESLPPLFFKTWWLKLVYFKSANQWAFGAAVCLWLAVICFVLWRIFSKFQFLKLGGKMLLFAFVLFLFFGFYVHKNINSKQFAIVTKTSTQAKTAPDKKSKNAFKLYEGYKIKVIDNLGNWSEVVNTEGKKGWVESNALETI
jgi:hypothetical protein